MGNVLSFGAFRTAVSALMGRYQFGRVAGRSYEGKRDIYDALGYPTVITPQMYREEYLRNGVGARVVESFPKATWRKGGTLIEDDNPEVTTPFEKAWETLDEKFGLWSLFQRLDILAGLGRYAIMVFGAPGKLHEPLDKLTVDQLSYFSLYSEENAPIQSWDTSEESPRYGLPTSYQLRRVQFDTMSMGSGTTPILLGTTRVVHFSRVLHVSDGLLEDNVYGIPRLERIWNRLMDLEKVTGGGSEAFWRRADGGMQFELDPEMRLGETAEEEKAALTAMKEEVEEYVHGLKRYLTTRGMTINRQGSDVANFAGPAAAIIDQIASATGIPQRILTGSERGQLASSQDKSNWDERVSDRRTDFAETRIVRPFVNRLVELKALPAAKEYRVEWPEFEELTEAEKLDAGLKAASINKTAGGIVVTHSEIRTHYMGLEVMTPEQEKEVEALTPAPPPVKPTPVPPENKPTPKPPAVVQTALGRAVAAAVEYGRETLNRSQLRTALQRSDQKAIDAYLFGAQNTVTKVLSTTIPRILSHRIAGGPGSGYYGHAGRPGEIGGSAPGSTIDTKNFTTVFNRELEITKAAQPLVARGFRVSGVHNLNAEVRDGAHISEDYVPSSKQVQDISDAFETVRGVDPDMYAYLQNSPVAFVKYEPGDATMTTATGLPSGPVFLINGNADLNAMTEKGWSVGTKDHARSVGDEYKEIMLHEIGHAYDARSGGMLSHRILKDVVNKFIGDTDYENLDDMEKISLDHNIKQWLRTTVSGYAAKGGPAETVGEIAALSLTGRSNEIPPEFKFIDDYIRHRDVKQPRAAAQVKLPQVKKTTFWWDTVPDDLIVVGHGRKI